MTIPAWEGNWLANLAGAVNTLGFSSLADYASSRVSSTYHQLAAELGVAARRTFAPVQVEHALRDDAIASGKIDLFVRVSLVRHLRHLMPNGWSSQDGSPLPHAIGAWGSRVPKEYQERCLKVGKMLVKSQLPEGWLPRDCSDGFLVHIFKQVGLQ